MSARPSHLRKPRCRSCRCCRSRQTALRSVALRLPPSDLQPRSKGLPSGCAPRRAGKLWFAARSSEQQGPGSRPTPRSTAHPWRLIWLQDSLMAPLNHPQMALGTAVGGGRQPFPPRSFTSVGSALRSEKFPDSRAPTPFPLPGVRPHKVLDVSSRSVPARTHRAVSPPPLLCPGPEDALPTRPGRGSQTPCGSPGDKQVLNPHGDGASGKAPVFRRSPAHRVEIQICLPSCSKA